MRVDVESTVRKLTMEVTPNEALLILADFDQKKGPSYETKQLIGGLMSIAKQKEHGGN